MQNLMFDSQTKWYSIRARDGVRWGGKGGLTIQSHA
jgi:hypothetical protein